MVGERVEVDTMPEGMVEGRRAHEALHPAEEEEDVGVVDPQTMERTAILLAEEVEAIAIVGAEVGAEAALDMEDAALPRMSEEEREVAVGASVVVAPSRVRGAVIDPGAEAGRGLKLAQFLEVQVAVGALHGVGVEAEVAARVARAIRAIVGVVVAVEAGAKVRAPCAVMIRKAQCVAVAALRLGA